MGMKMEENTLSALVADGRELLRRMLALAPAADDVAWATRLAARWRERPMGAGLEPLDRLNPITLDDLLGIDNQKRRLDANTEQFVRGLPANNALLWGARGTGKSSLVHALLNRYADQGLRLVEVGKSGLADIAAVAERLERLPFRFLLVCDDLSFEADDPSYKALKSALEGSLFRQSDNLLIYVTSNRRHLLPERFSDNQAAYHAAGELHESEAVEEKISLSDRFGLWLSFRPFRQDDYLLAARHWLERLAGDHGARVAWDDAARHAALQWALARGGRSGRNALHFAKQHVGEALLAAARTQDD